MSDSFFDEAMECNACYKTQVNLYFYCEDCRPVWISCKKKLPIPNNWTLYAVLTNQDNLYKKQIAYYSTSKEWFMETDQKNPIKVDFWLKLPKEIVI